MQFLFEHLTTFIMFTLAFIIPMAEFFGKHGGTEGAQQNSNHFRAQVQYHRRTVYKTKKIRIQ